MSIADTGNISNIVESLIQYSSWFFPDGCQFTRHQLSEEQIDKISNRFVQKDGESPEPPSISGAGSLFSEVSKKLGWNKEGQTETTHPTPTYEHSSAYMQSNLYLIVFLCYFSTEV